MALEVRCDCGNVYSLDANMAGRKVRCGNCGQVVRVPETSAPTEELELQMAPEHEVVPPPPIDDMLLPPEDDMMAAPAPMEIPASMLSMEEDAASPVPPPIPEVEEEEEEEEVRAPRCPVCGSDASPEDTVCLACGADIGNSGGAGGALNKLLDKFPMKARIGIGVGLGILLLFWAGYAFWKSRQDSNYVAAAQTKMDLEDFKGALVDFKTALEWNPKNVNAIKGAIDCTLKANPKASISTYTRNLAQASRDEDVDKEKIGEICLSLARYYSRQIKSSQDSAPRGNATKYLDMAKRNAGDMKGLTELRGHISFRAQDWIQAKTYYEDSDKAGTEDPLVFLNLARILLKDKMVDEAKAYIEKAKTANPAEANVELARIKEKEKDFETALGHWKAAVDAKSDLQPARVGYGRALLRASKYKEALKQVNAAKELLSDLDDNSKKATYALRANTLFRLNKFIDALNQAEELLILDPKSNEGQFVKGAILLKQGLKAKDTNKQKQGKSLLDKAVRRLNNPKDYVGAAEILGQIKSMQQ
ncbi:MAG: tetratricopeptide repeat protein, partial [Planctomycetota bacterium]|nr:tetratricopeptide repeat protein [Planctomycetota bacterium]